jgi:hypothetical protein
MPDTHAPVPCFQDGHGQYAFRNWTFAFRCPACDRTGRFNLNYLGQRNVVCNGVKFTKEDSSKYAYGLGMRIRTEEQARAVLGGEDARHRG